MLNNKTLFILVFSFFIQLLTAQKPQKLSSVEIYNQIQKLNFLGSVLYIAAHPDDENTRLISYLSNEKKARTAYLSLTRGDGGQNLIGPQLRELLGVIRTQELIEARKIDGGEQFFSRANDFGFSKTPDETLQIWDKEKVLADVIWSIRKFKPDVIINRFDHRTAGNTHGHHTASAILSTESFSLSYDPTVFPEQLQYVQPWQTNRMFFNPSVWFYGSQAKFDAADKSNFMTLETGVYYSNLGKSNQEIAALSRSSHKSQGFGSMGHRGKETEYLEFIQGNPLIDKSDIFEGIDTSWNRVTGGQAIGQLVAKIASGFDFSEPAATIPDLLKLYSMIENLEDEHWKTVKLEELKNIIVACSGLYLEAVSENPEANPGDTIKFKLETINRCPVPMVLTGITTKPDNNSVSLNQVLSNNQLKNFNIDIQLPSTIEYTQPYWLKTKGTLGMYVVDQQENIGNPDIIRTVKVIFNVKINNTIIPFERNVVYKYTDKVKGEMYQYFDVVPQVTSGIIEKVSFFKERRTKSIGVKIKAGKDNLKGNLVLELPSDWSVKPEQMPFYIDQKGKEQIVYFSVTPPANPSEVTAKSVIYLDSQKYDKEQTSINFDHISTQQVLFDSEAKFSKLDLKINNENIGYIMGAGDEVPKCLKQMGYNVTILNPENITTTSIDEFDVIILGIRAYNTLPILSNKQDILFDFVKKGKTMIVQYNTPDGTLPSKIAPYPLKISRDRVTDENASVDFLAPNHPILQYPNKITKKDFEGWTQEQGLYYPNEYDSAFISILSSHDKGESPKEGALLVAPYGKGHYIYTGLSLFRELPAGVSGAYRLIANMISLKGNHTETSDVKQ